MLAPERAPAIGETSKTELSRRAMFNLAGLLSPLTALRLSPFYELACLAQFDRSTGRVVDHLLAGAVPMPFMSFIVSAVLRAKCLHYLRIADNCICNNYYNLIVFPLPCIVSSNSICPFPLAKVS